MFEALNSACLAIMDLLLGWALHLPRDVVLIAVGVGTALLLTVVRLVTTDQGLLSRCAADKARLRELIREAKKRGDKEAVGRHRTTMRQIGAVQFRAEGKPLLASVVPIALVAVWCFSRIAYLPPRPGDAVTVRAYFPVAGIGRLAHVAPQDGVEAETGWIQRVREDVAPWGEVTNGVAEWTLRCEGRDEPYQLAIRYAGGSHVLPLTVDGVRYSPPLESFDGESLLAAEVALRPYKLFGLVPGTPGGFLAPWLVGYLVIVLPFSFLLKPLLRIR